jgi:hypothetical protein
MYRPVSGRSAAWLARPSGGREVESSNLSGPTIKNPPACPVAERAVSYPADEGAET